MRTVERRGSRVEGRPWLGPPASARASRPAGGGAVPHRFRPSTLDPRPSSCRGFTLIETSISTLLVGLLVVASLQTVAAVLRQRSRSSDKTIALLLADEMLAEIREMAYREPSGGTTFGPESDEVGNRALFDDVDDFNGYSESPPQYRDGTVMTQLTGWTRTVTVQEVTASDALLTATLTDGTTPVGVGLKNGGSSGTGVRRITVNVSKNGALLASVQGLRTASW